MQYIMTQDEKQIVFVDKLYRIAIYRENDAVLIRAIVSDAERPVVLGRYADSDMPKAILQDIAEAMANGQNFYMPLSRLIAPEKEVHDARTRRRGGS